MERTDKLNRRIRNENRDNHNGLHCLAGFFEHTLVNCNGNHNIQKSSESGKYHVIHQSIFCHRDESRFGCKQEFEVFNSIPWTCPDSFGIVE